MSAWACDAILANGTEGQVSCGPWESFPCFSTEIWARKLVLVKLKILWFHVTPGPETGIQDQEGGHPKESRAWPRGEADRAIAFEDANEPLPTLIWVSHDPKCPHGLSHLELSVTCNPNILVLTAWKKDLGFHRGRLGGRRWAGEGHVQMVGPRARLGDSRQRSPAWPAHTVDQWEGGHV